MPANMDQKRISEIISDISEGFNQKVETLKLGWEKEFSGWLLQTMSSKFVVFFTNYYHAFYKYVKTSHTVLLTGSLLPPHNMMKELKNMMSKYSS